MALEWTHQNIRGFGGNPNNITVGGYSAGAYSAWYQLQYDLFLPEPSSRIIRRSIIQSNGPGIPPKGLAEVQPQFDELVDAFKIPTSWTAKEKLAALREVPAEQLRTCIPTLHHQSFRTVADGKFIRDNLFHNIQNGTFARAVAQNNITILVGNVEDEGALYGLMRPPQSQATLIGRLSVEFPRLFIAAILPYYCSDPSSTDNNWPEIFSRMYSDLQVYATQRGFLSALVSHDLPPSKIFRYEIRWRATASALPPELGVTHGTDMMLIWFFNKKMLLPEEQKVVREWVKPLGAFFEAITMK